MPCRARAGWALRAALLALAVLAAAGSVPVAVAATDERAPLLGQKLRLVERLLASASERHGAESDARSALEGVGVLVASARADLASGSLDEAETALDEALRQVSAIARGARAAASPRPQLQDRYRQLLEGVRGFRAAFAEVVAEKGEATAAVLDGRRLDALVDAAERAADEQRYAEGVRRLAEAYQMLSLALTEVRASETLEHRLVFASPAEEYRYEQERYKSHELLIKLMVAEREPAADTLARIHGEVERAMALDDRARTLAGSGDYAAAIRSQEAAVDHLVKALQQGGLFVPQ
jgi:hypothetical protein